MYYKTIEKDGCVYSIDRFTFDFYFLPESGLYELLKTSLDLLTLEYRQKISVQSFTTNRLGYEKLIYQFDHLHVELWRRENIITLSRYLPEASCKHWAASQSSFGGSRGKRAPPTLS